jgi:hypothetical protein
MSNINTTKLKFHTETGKQFVMQLAFDDTIGTLRYYLNSYMKSIGVEEYEIRSSFPPKVYSNPNQSLYSAGLIPTATLFLK